MAPGRKTGGRKSKIDMLSKAERDKAVADIILGRRSMYAVGRDLGIADTSVGRYMVSIPEEERLHIIATAMGKAKMAELQDQADIVNEFGEDTDKDLKWVLRELKSLLSDAKGDDDKTLALGTLKELRQSLMALADLHGKLNKRMDVHLNLNESPQFIQLRSIILKVLNNHPAAKHEFLDEMDRMGVIGEPVLVDDRT